MIKHYLYLCRVLLFKFMIITERQTDRQAPYQGEGGVGVGGLVGVRPIKLPIVSQQTRDIGHVGFMLVHLLRRRPSN